MNNPIQDAIEDVHLEVRISMAAKQDMTKPGNWEALKALIKKRSPSQVEKMERSRGLAK